MIPTTRNRPAKNRQGTARPDLRVIGVVIGIVVAVVLVAVLVIDGGDDAADASSQYGVVTTSGGPLPPLPEGGDDPATGALAPDLLSERAEGTVTVEPAADGEPTMLVFLAHWCPHCQSELPRLVDLAEDGAFDGVRTVAVLTSTDEDSPNYPPSAWIDEEAWTGDRFFDDEGSTAAAAYGVTSFPYVAYVDADGTVTRRHAGAQTEEQVMAAIDEITP